MKFLKIFTFFFIFFLLLFMGTNSAIQAQVSDEKIPGGMLQVLSDNKDEILELPLNHTDVKVEISGYISRVEVSQEFINPYEEPIEAIYTFPLPENAAIDEMEMIIGERVIKGVMKEREEAKKIYEEAKQAGKRTSLLEQEKANIFTQSVANILPGDNIIIKITYIL